MYVQNVTLIVSDNQRNRNIPLGLENSSNVCVFNSVVQALFSLQSFRDHVKHFTTNRPSDADAVLNIKTLFRDIEQLRERSRRPIRSHECVRSLGITGYVGNSQFDGEECITRVVNLFCP